MSEMRYEVWEECNKPSGPKSTAVAAIHMPRSTDEAMTEMTEMTEMSIEDFPATIYFCVLVGTSTFAPYYFLLPFLNYYLLPFLNYYLLPISKPISLNLTII